MKRTRGRQHALLKQQCEIPDAGPQQRAGQTRVHVPQPAHAGRCARRREPGQLQEAVADQAPDQSVERGARRYCQQQQQQQQGQGQKGAGQNARRRLHAAQPLVQGDSHERAAGHRHQPVQAHGGLRLHLVFLGGLPLHGRPAGAHRLRHHVDRWHDRVSHEEQHAGRTGGAGQPAAG